MPDHVDPNARSLPTTDGPLPERTNTFASEGDHTDGEDPSHIDPTTFLAPKQKPDELGRLGPYRVLKLLGKGGMGFVFLAEDEMLERKIALKVMRPDVAVKANAKERFLREGRAAAKVKHDNVICIYAVGEERGMPFLALEYLEGMPLDEYLKTKGEIALEQAIRIARETAEGLRAAHKHGLIHRDIKPANIWLEAPAARVKVLDFGLARQEKENTHLTQSGAVVGTPAYMSPEQGRGVEIDARSDLWSVGVMLYRLCTGEMPFVGETTLGVLTAIAVDQPPPPRTLNRKIPEALEQIILRLLQKKPENRFQSAEELITALSTLEKAATAPQMQKVVYVPMAVPAETNPFEGIDDSDYANPAAANREAKTETRNVMPPKAIPKRETNPKNQHGEPTRNPVVHATGSSKKNRLLVFGIAVLALAIGGFFALRSSNKDEPKPDGTVKNNDPPPAKFIEDDPPPKKDQLKPDRFAGGPALLKASFTKEQAETARIAWAKHLNIPERKELDLGKGVKLDLVLIPPGEFLMGSPPTEKDHRHDEVLHTVIISKPFYMAVTETTQEQWEAVIGANPSDFAPTGKASQQVVALDTSKFPVENISWGDARKFCSKLRVDLPTEAQWEYACRSGTTSAFYFGNKLTPTDGNFALKGDFAKKLDRTVQVRTYSPNSFELYDMHGNVCEWCRDYFAETLDDLGANDPVRTTQSSTAGRVRRDGSWKYPASSCRSAQRTEHDITSRQNHNGFRVVAPITDDRPVLLTKGPEVSFDLGNDIKLEVVKINAKGKSFLMGSPKDDPERSTGSSYDPEEQHEVTFNHDWYMGKYEVTQEQYAEIAGTHLSKFRGAKNPVETVSWDDSQEFIKKLNDKFKDRKIKFRLPSEAEWEYACRAGTETSYYFGKTLTTQQANFSGSETKPVGLYPANAFGLHDMHGNVREWCEDYDGPYIKAPKDGTAQPVKQTSDVRVLRGGNWNNSGRNCRSAIRNNYAPNIRNSSGDGFRVAAAIADDSPLLPKKDAKE